MKRLRELKSLIMTVFDMQAGFHFQDDIIRFHSVPLNSWIPSIVIGLFCMTIGIFIFLREPKNWFLTLILGIASWIIIVRAKHGMD